MSSTSAAPAPSDIRPTGNPAPTLGAELTDLLERHGIPAGSDTPAYILAEFLVRALTTFEVGINRREEWHTTIRIDEDGSDWAAATAAAAYGVQASVGVVLASVPLDHVTIVSADSYVMGTSEGVISSGPLASNPTDPATIGVQMWKDTPDG